MHPTWQFSVEKLQNELNKFKDYIEVPEYVHRSGGLNGWSLLGRVDDLQSGFEFKVGIQHPPYKTQDMTDPDPKVYYKMDYAREHKIYHMMDYDKPTSICVGYFKEVIENGGIPQYQYPENHGDDHLTIQPGTTEGILLGGNLTVLCSLIGSEYLPDFTDSILYLEDVGEDVYRVDRMLTQLKMSGILNKINGFIFGKCTDCDAGANSLSLEQVFNEHISPLNIPAFYGALISHEIDNSTIPAGIKASMIAELGSIQLMEPAVINS